MASVADPVPVLASPCSPTVSQLFLKEFVGEVSKDVMWAHMDIAGPVWNDKLGGATGYGVRTLAGFVEAMGEK